MAGSFAQLGAKLKLDISDFSSKLSQASTGAKKFAADINGKTVSAMEELNKQTKAWGLNLKSVSRVVSGILISQAFYRALQSILAATDAVWEFSKQLEYAHIAYSNLFGDTALAAEFINVLKDFAAKTPFSFTEAESAAKRLLAYGIEYKNVMYVMQGVMSASAIQGDPAKIEAISRAFGQIYTYGKLMTQEVRQLSEAGIPAFEILQEELGLTQEQLRNLGNEGIPASDAINALVDGIQKRFGNVTVAAAKTTQGIISNIKDNATMLFAGIFEPLTVFIKSALVEVGEFFYTLREIFEFKGIGGVFEALVPEGLQSTLRQFIANLSNVFLAIMRLVSALSGLLKPAMMAIIQVFNAFTPILTVVINTIATIIDFITSNAVAMRNLTAILAAAAAMWVAYKVKALAAAVVTAVITGISKALAVMSTMLTFVVAHPFWTLLAGLAAVLVGISGGFGAISDKVSGFFKQITKFNGVDPDKILLPSQKERANDLDKFNKKLDGTSDAMDDLADSTGKATKAAKGLLSFDEVFKLNEPDEGTGNGIEVPEIDGLLDGLDGLGDTYMPEVPDFSDYLNRFKEAWDVLRERMQGIIAAAIAAAFGGVLGMLIGGALGGKIGLVVGAIVGYFWNMLADYFGLTPDQKISAGIIGGVGALIGAALGGIVGGPLGAKIGAIIGGFVGSFWGLFAEKLGVTPPQHLATLLSGAISGLFQAGFNLAKSLIANLIPVFMDDVFVGFAKAAGFSLKGALSGAIKQGVVGAIVGLVTGMLSNALTAWIAGELDLTEKDLENAATGQFVGNIAGSIVGMILGGPMGSLIGGALGQLGGSIIGEFWDYMSTTLKGAVIGGTAGLPVGAIVGTLVGSIGGPLGAALGAVIGVALGGLIGLIVDKWDAIKQFFANIGSAIADFVSWIGDGLASIGSTIAGFFSSIGSTIAGAFNTVKDRVVGFFSAAGTAVSNALAPIRDAFVRIGTVVKDVFSGVVTVFKDVFSAISTVWKDIAKAVKTVLNDIWAAITTVWNDILSAITTVGEAIWGVISGIWGLIRDIIVKTVTDIWNAVVEWFEPIAEKISFVCSQIWETITEVFTNILNSITDKLHKIWTNVKNAFTSIYTVISQALQNVWSFVSSIFTKIANTVSQAVQNILNTITRVFTNIYNKIKSVLTNVWNTVKSIFTSIKDTIKNALSTAFDAVTNFFSKIYSTIKTRVSDSYNAVKNGFSNIYGSIKDSISNMYNTVKNGIKNIYDTFTGWISDLWDNVFGKFFEWISDGIDGLREFFGLSKDANFEINTSDVNIPSGGNKLRPTGHALGGIFDREHIARLNEGNKTEAVIPLENASAMQPFVDAVSNGITASLAPMLANFSGGGAQPLYVGTLIADDRGLKELERKMQVIRMQENRR